jgi:putative transposase
VRPNHPFEPTSHSRRHPAHPPPIETGNRAIIIFLTVCTAEGKGILADEQAVGVILDAWQAADHWSVGRYIILPDHLHLFCAPARQHVLPVQSWVAFWKSRASNWWPRPQEQPIWQTDC